MGERSEDASMLGAWFSVCGREGISFEDASKWAGEVTEDPGYYERVGFAGLLAMARPETKRNEREQYQWEQDGQRVKV